jgi:hypothetical protein
VTVTLRPRLHQLLCFCSTQILRGEVVRIETYTYEAVKT